MKRIILIIVALSCLSVVAHAELPDVSSLSTDELHELQAILINELGERKELPAFTAPISTYEVGKDFPVGEYLISPNGPLTYITIYDNKQNYNSDKPIKRMDKLYQEDEMSMIYDFKFGMIVDIGFSPARFEPYTGLKFE